MSRTLTAIATAIWVAPAVGVAVGYFISTDPFPPARGLTGGDRVLGVGIATYLGGFFGRSAGVCRDGAGDSGLSAGSVFVACANREWHRDRGSPGLGRRRFLGVRQALSTRVRWLARRSMSKFARPKGCWMGLLSQL